MDLLKQSVTLKESYFLKDSSLEHITKTKELLQKLISYPTISADSNLDLIQFIANYLEDLGAKVFIDQNEDGKKANLFGTLGGKSANSILLSGHTDVVPVSEQKWDTDPFNLSQKDEITIIGEPTMMKVIEGHKGCCEYTTHFRGKAGHGSMPELGVNAVEYAMRFGTKLINLTNELKSRKPSDSKFDPPWTTVNIGQIEGGIAHNVIPENCSLSWEFRPVQGSDYDYVKRTMETYVSKNLFPQMQKKYKDAKIYTEVVGEVTGLEPTEINEARDIVLELTGQNHADLVSFGTEAGIYNSLGSSVVVCGPGSIEQAHKPNEFISLQQLNACLSF
ncbi:MAG: acetylornithine deacetylase, partial [Rhodobacterales bacterium]|nr:acetylornithine deacetylase [Rhodobacterales bacterium]